ncbi:LysR family transcriptional regulator [Dyella silvatica]|uniref:LysR family transcriptional regulator n=1 Tax=Dyella silvatica TaxID=2992128 RepID=UPI002252DBC0|nr:LysR family transcriptional regulator [Dyella silvatica]
MANHDPSWELYRSFLAVMREGSLSAAARMLGMTQPSLGRHVRELEAKLGVALFARSPQGLTPTDIAHELVPHAQSMAAASAALRRAASANHDDIRGVIRVTASEMVGTEVLPSMLADFRQQHPGIVIELSLSNQSEDLLRRDADIAIRMVQPTQGALVARHVGKVAIGLYAHQRYIKVNGRPKTMDELVAHALIGFDNEAPYIRSLRPKGSPFVRENFALRTDSDMAALAAIRAGYGIGFAQVGIARRDPKLIRLMPDSLELNLDTWVVMHEDLRRSVRNRKLFDHLAGGLGAYTQLKD